LAQSRQAEASATISRVSGSKPNALPQLMQLVLSKKIRCPHAQ
jgi:hypothetical protein